MKHERHIHFCDHCGKPAVFHERRTTYEGTECETNSTFWECRDCYNLNNRKVFAQNISEAEKEKNMAFTRFCIDACEDIYALGDKLNEQGFKNLQPRWKRMWKMDKPVPDNFNLVVMAYVVVDKSHVDTTITIMHAYHGNLHQIEMTFPDATVADVGRYLLSHVKCAPGARIAIRDTSTGNIYDDECYVPHLVANAKHFSRAIGEATKLMPWYINMIDQFDADYESVAPAINLPTIKI